MIRVLGIIGAVLVLALGVILVLAAMKPDTFRVARATTIHAPPEKIFPLIADMPSSIRGTPTQRRTPA